MCGVVCGALPRYTGDGVSVSFTPPGSSTLDGSALATLPQNWFAARSSKVVDRGHSDHLPVWVDLWFVTGAE